MTTRELNQRDLGSFLVLSILVHAAALLVRAPSTPSYVEPPSEVLVLEMIDVAPVTAAPKMPEPPPPAPPVQEEAPPPPVPAVTKKATPAPAPRPKPKPAVQPRPVPEQAAKPAPTQAQRPAPAVPVARAPEASPVAKARYEDLLYSWLVRHKEYPLVARRRGLEGRPVVTVRIDRAGHVVASRVSKPSRYPMLDEAAVAMVRRADPFPPLPADVGGDSYEFVAPVEYRLR